MTKHFRYSPKTPPLYNTQWFDLLQKNKLRKGCSYRPHCYELFQLRRKGDIFEETLISFTLYYFRHKALPFSLNSNTDDGRKFEGTVMHCGPTQQRLHDMLSVTWQEQRKLFELESPTACPCNRLLCMEPQNSLKTWLGPCRRKRIPQTMPVSRNSF